LERDRFLAWVRLRKEVLECTDCLLHRDRTNAVPGNGVWESEVMVVGEAPGTVEDREGLPFIGPSGKHLRERLEGAGIDPDSLYITNTCRCIPKNGSGVRAPTRSERLACRKYLVKSVQLLQPKLIVPVGGVALGAFCQDGRDYITREHGRMQESRMVACKRWMLFPLHHPAAAMRRRQTWDEELAQDTLELAKVLDNLLGMDYTGRDALRPSGQA
jgi:DNA polymerase